MIAFVQPFIPHYREEFFQQITAETKADVFVFNQSVLYKNNFRNANINQIPLKRIFLWKFLIFDPFPLLVKKNKVLVLMLDFSHLTTWLLLFTKFIHKKRIVLWGQGISVKRYIKEESRPNFFLKAMIALSDTTWLYTQREVSIWKTVLPNKEIISINNTLSGINDIINFNSNEVKLDVKSRYKIKEEFVLIFCARFNNEFRRIDLFLEVIDKLDSDRFGFIVIGDGPAKPNFLSYENVYDFGSLYDNKIKKELFYISDIYFQPGWVGLSIVEALGYGKPVFTFKRSSFVLQCVEYSYLVNHSNSLIFDSVDELIVFSTFLNNEVLESLSLNAKAFAIDNLKMDYMVGVAFVSLNKFL